jgi:hypothetical protein
MGFASTMRATLCVRDRFNVFASLFERFVLHRYWQKKSGLASMDEAGAGRDGAGGGGGGAGALSRVRGRDGMAEPGEAEE